MVEIIVQLTEVQMKTHISTSPFILQQQEQQQQQQKQQRQQQINPVEYFPPIHSKHAWKDGTVLIAGDSILNGIDEKRMGKDIKVRANPGAEINDMFYYLSPLLSKKPKYVILHVSSNDSINKDS